MSADDQNFASKLGEVFSRRRDPVEYLQAKLPNILSEEPDWDMFAERLEFIDDRGRVLEGLEATQSLWKVLNNALSWLDVKDGIKVEAVRFLDAGDRLVEARWKGKVERVGPDDSPIDFEAEISFHIDVKNQIDYVKLDRWVFNGKQGSSDWPSVDLAYAPSSVSNLQAIENWLKLQGIQGARSRYALESGSEDVALSESEMGVVMGLRRTQAFLQKNWVPVVVTGLILAFLSGAFDDPSDFEASSSFYFEYRSSSLPVTTVLPPVFSPFFDPFFPF